MGGRGPPLDAESRGLLMPPESVVFGAATGVVVIVELAIDGVSGGSGFCSRIESTVSISFSPSVSMGAVSGVVSARFSALIFGSGCLIAAVVVAALSSSLFLSPRHGIFLGGAKPEERESPTLLFISVAPSSVPSGCCALGFVIVFCVWFSVWKRRKEKCSRNELDLDQSQHHTRQRQRQQEEGAEEGGKISGNDQENASQEG